MIINETLEKYRSEFVVNKGTTQIKNPLMIKILKSLPSHFFDRMLEEIYITDEYFICVFTYSIVRLKSQIRDAIFVNKTTFEWNKELGFSGDYNHNEILRLIKEI